MEEQIEIKVATAEELPEILRLQSENQIAQGGTLSGGMSSNQIEEMMKDMPQIVAVIDNQVVGFLLTTSQAVSRKRNIPIVEAMLASYAGNTNSYIYGPVCVSQTQRGKGLAQLMFKELLHQEPHREGILFIRSDNEASLRAHEKMGIKKVADFSFNNNEFHVFAYKF